MYRVVSRLTKRQSSYGEKEKALPYEKSSCLSLEQAIKVIPHVTLNVAFLSKPKSKEKKTPPHHHSRHYRLSSITSTPPTPTGTKKTQPPPSELARVQPLNRQTELIRIRRLCRRIRLELLFFFLFPLPLLIPGRAMPAQPQHSHTHTHTHTQA